MVKLFNSSLFIYTVAAVFLLIIASFTAWLLLDRRLEITLHSYAENVLHTGELLGSEAAPQQIADTLLQMENVTGVEIFGADGRRVAQAGEPLEIASYSLSRESLLQHDARNGARYEVFWPERLEQDQYGMAVSIDTAAFKNSSRDLLLWIVLIVLVSLVVTICLVHFYRTFKAQRNTQHRRLRVSD